MNVNEFAEGLLSDLSIPRTTEEFVGRRSAGNYLVRDPNDPRYNYFEADMLNRNRGFFATSVGDAGNMFCMEAYLVDVPEPVSTSAPDESNLLDTGDGSSYASEI